ncbi:hypothetical protein N799_02145 [Lysobacter arseniciresistens ZS79]|uniref:Uncharacterized protein n=1 Tax=Lysobacter arseniciresistens ZS79 TaxID=913325 RepID=A0A0A0F2E2_9GAMM|nr:hypothetical protein [Lysobacter arseniciresistens]KGM56715.1 hypothetical protein N799_02145 [Lysobacter arseniciresistens ZS79]
MNARAYPFETDSFGWRTRHAAALLGSCASRSMRVLAVALAVAFGALSALALATIDNGEWLSVTLFLSGLAVSALWGIWLARLVLLHTEARQSRTPGVEMAIGGTVSLAFLATVLLPSLLLAAGGIDFALSVCALALAAGAGVLVATLPRIFYLLLCLAPLLLGLLYSLAERLLPAGALELPPMRTEYITWAVLPVLALAGWRWFKVARQAPDDARSVWWQPAVTANPRTGGGFDWLSGDASSAQLPDWLWPAGQTFGAGPARPVRAMRALMGTPFAPLSGGQLVVQLGIGVVVIAYFLLQMDGDPHDASTLVGGAAGGAAVMVVMYAQRLEAIYRKPGTELDELALLPGLGDMPLRRTRLLSAVARAPAIAMAMVLVLLLGLGLAIGLEPRLLALVVMAGVGVVLTTALSCLRPLAGLPMNGWRMLLLAAPVLLLAMGTITYATAVKAPGPTTPLVLALTWLAAYALLGLAIAAAWRRLNNRPHPFLPY